MKHSLFLIAFLLILNSSTKFDTYLAESLTQEFDINDYTWLVGSWEGDGFGGTSEEIWSVPHNGTMMGMYRHIKNGELIFYEFLLLDESGLRLKHFHPDLKGWEEKDETTFFKMIDYSSTKIEMKGLIFEKKSENQMEIRLKLNRNGNIETEVFTMNKIDL
ncbi:MAG TPA: hypothetical protein DF712_08520 [Balneola sp.]|jgi:hypothetical protein|nr:hypothetical protein [Bacteroidota bacterium]MAC06177.1 hypothetical protein [Balneola sp.]MAO78533.1 hypothetical protein [Balneola sp.]MBF64898.1 hypothetical protein [Balneola sp.]HBZ38311.1 hypothetical protein [Balneola sp.]|tara:strand:+ start:18813 stop:19295 length:483 start_codon:yes stop_codon:yes gene_type:complete